jgi:hypothetical protein
MVNKIKAKRLELDVSCINDTLAHMNLIKLLKQNELFSTEFLYRGTGEDELRVMLRQKAHNQRNVASYGMKISVNSIDCYNIDQMEAILMGNDDRMKSPVSYATGSENPMVLVYHARFLEFLGNRSNFDYVFRNPKNRAEALAAIVGLV